MEVAFVALRITLFSIDLEKDSVERSGDLSRYHDSTGISGAYMLSLSEWQVAPHIALAPKMLSVFPVFTSGHVAFIRVLRSDVKLTRSRILRRER
jgi:hypothetical protein